MMPDQLAEIAKDSIISHDRRQPFTIAAAAQQTTCVSSNAVQQALLYPGADSESQGEGLILKVCKRWRHHAFANNPISAIACCLDAHQSEQLVMQCLYVLAFMFEHSLRQPCCHTLLCPLILQMVHRWL
jgi:hypothetical protein